MRGPFLNHDSTPDKTKLGLTTPKSFSQEHQDWVLSDIELLDGVMVLQHDLLLKLGQFLSILSPFPRGKKKKKKGLTVP